MNEMRLFDPFLLDPLEDTVRAMMRPWRASEMAEPSPRIRIDLAERNGTYQVRAEIPGVRKEDIDVRIEGNLVTISAEMKKAWEEESKEGRYALQLFCSWLGNCLKPRHQLPVGLFASRIDIGVCKRSV